MRKMKLSLLLTFLLLVSSCSNVRNSSLKENLREFSLNELNKLNEQSTFLSYKHSVENKEVQKMLLEYLKYFDNASYQIIATGTFNADSMRTTVSKKQSLTSFMDNYNIVGKMPKNQIAKLIFDYEQLQTKEKIDILRSNMDDLEYRIEVLEKN